MPKPGMSDGELLAFLAAYLEAVRLEVTSHWAWGAGQLLAHDAFAEPDERYGVAAQISTIVSVVTIGLVAIIAILIFDEVTTSIGSPSNTALSNAESNVTDGFGDAMDLVPIVLLVLVASLVIAVVQQF